MLEAVQVTMECIVTEHCDYVTENMGFTAIGLTVLAICVQANPNQLYYLLVCDPL